LKLPICELRSQIQHALAESNRVLLTAPTGSGKSTQVPQFVADNSDIRGTVLVLEPRRLAARMLARRVASERDGRVGDEVGFQTRFESAKGAHTRILFVTEGILPRMVQGNRNLDGIGAVILDEFHERHLTGDIALGLVRRIQETRDDLRLIVMSATLQLAELEKYLAPSMTLSSDGRLFPVHSSHLPPAEKRPVWDTAAKALASITRSGEQGDVLVFMPGGYEIRRTIDACRSANLGEPITLLPLYGDLSNAAQDEAFAPCDRRKVIVSTNIAETSLTIPGVRHVIDSGLARVNRYDPGRGINTLFVEPISRASATQRAGRAGREAPGTCRRLYTQREFENRPEATDAEVLRVDFAETMLYLRSIGLASAEEFPWLSRPPEEALARARSLLHAIGAIVDGKLTAAGREFARLPVHPRLGRLLLTARDEGCLELGLISAALLGERGITSGGRGGEQAFAKRFANTLRDDDPESDLAQHIHALRFAREKRYDRRACEAVGVNGVACRQVWASVDHLRRACERIGWDNLDRRPSMAELIRCVVVSFPDHLAVRREKGTLVCRLPGGSHGELAKSSSVRDARLLVAAECRHIGSGKGSRVQLSLACEVREEWLPELFPGLMRQETEVVWNDLRRAVEKHRRDYCGELLLGRATIPEIEPDLAAAVLAREILSRKLVLSGRDANCKAWLRRVAWLREALPQNELIAYDEDEMEIILAEFAHGARRYGELKNKPLLPFLRNAMSWADQQYVDEMAPPTLPLPSGRKLRIDYRAGHAPRGRARIQELFGLTETPSVGGGKIRVTIELLGPNMRPVQITDDLAGFWRELYPKVRIELKRRYPRHDWREV
jgi:ATP-dependent helicase HrpB